MNRSMLAVIVLGAMLAGSAPNAWALGKIVTLAEERTFPAATNPNVCKVFEFDPIAMKQFGRVTFVGRSHGPDPVQFSILYLFSLEPVKFSVPAPSGTTIGGQCDALPPHDVFPPNNQFACQAVQGAQGGAAPYIAVALFSCSSVPITVTVKAYLFN